MGCFLPTVAAERRAILAVRPDLEDFWSRTRSGGAIAITLTEREIVRST
jgi:hypothetical protein